MALSAKALHQKRQRKESKRNQKRKSLRKNLNGLQGKFRLDEQRRYFQKVLENKLRSGEIIIVEGKIQSIPPELRPAMKAEYELKKKMLDEKSRKSNQKDEKFELVAPSA
jgi:hypothetical protein